MDKYKVSVREWTDRSALTDNELENHKKNLIKKWNKKCYLKRKCKERKEMLEDLIIENANELDDEMLQELFEEIDALTEQIQNL